MITKPIKRTPLHAVLQKQGVAFTELAGWQVADQFSSAEAEMTAAKTAVALADQSANGKLTVQGTEAAAALSAAFKIDSLAIGEGTAVARNLVYRLRHDFFFVNTPPGFEAEAVAKLEKAAENIETLLTINDISNGRFQFQVIGPQSAALLSRLCGLDFHPAVFPDKHAKQSSVAKISQTILRHDSGELPLYSLIGAGSFGQYIWETVLEAGETLGIKLIGHSALMHLTNE